MINNLIINFEERMTSENENKNNEPKKKIKRKSRANWNYVLLIFVLLIFISINIFINYPSNDDFSNQTTVYAHFSTYVQTFQRIINPYQHKYILKPSVKICQSSLVLLTLVSSLPENFSNRNSIRKSWANKELFPGMYTVFIIGKSLNKTVNKKLIDEAYIHEDILQDDYIDSYKNLSIKTISAMKWASDYCTKKTKLVLKINDDLIMNSYSLIPFLEVNFKNSHFNNSLFCSPNKEMKVDRNVNSNFYVSENEYAREFFPYFCNGGAYLLSSDLPGMIYETSLYTKPFLTESIYIGILAEKLKTNIVSLKSKYCWTKESCFYALNRNIKQIYFFILNGMTSETILNGWLEITEKMFDVMMGKKKGKIRKFL